MSSPVFAEMVRVLDRPKLRKIMPLGSAEDILRLIVEAAEWFDEPRETVTDCRDEKDNPYLELALAASAAAILTGDDDLLVLYPWRGVRILRPADFLGWSG
jgi:uncharacterized protein